MQNFSLWLTKLTELLKTIFKNKKFKKKIFKFLLVRERATTFLNPKIMNI